MASTDFTARLGLPFVLSNQAQKHVTVNHSLRALDALFALSVIDRDLAAPPAGPSEGDRYLVAASATGNWVGHDGEIAAYADGGWLFFQPSAGWRLWVEDEARFQVYDGGLWRDATPDDLQNLLYLGLGATADASNPLLVKLNATLFTALETGSGGSGDLRFKLNKESSVNAISLLFQNNYSTRAEIGLIGDDDFLFKVSPDGSTFHEGIRLDRNTGRVSFPSGMDGMRERLQAMRTYFVDADTGSDSNTGLTSGTAFLTIQKAVDTVSELDLGGYDVTISVAAGTYANVVLSAPFVGRGIVTISGDITTPSNVQITGATTGLEAKLGAVISVKGIYFNCSQRQIYALTGGVISVTGKCRFGTCALEQVGANGASSQILILAPTIVSGSAQYYIRSVFGAFVQQVNQTIDFTMAATYSGFFVQAQFTATVYAALLTFSGSYASVTGGRYQANFNGVIYTGAGGASYFPGNVAGNSSTGGQYG